MRIVVPILHLMSKLSGKCQRFNAINRSIEMLKIVEFSKFSIKMKNCKTFCKANTVNRLKKFIQSPPIPPPTPDKTLLRLGNKFFLRRYIAIYRYLLSKCFKNAALRCQEMMQCKYSFWHHRIMFARKLVKSERFLAVLGSILFSLSSELRMTEVFLVKLYCKMCDLFC